MKMYKANNSYRHTITPVEVERMSEASVWINGSRNSRISDYESYWETFDEAREHLKSIEERRIARAQREIDSAKNNIKALNLLQHNNHPHPRII